MEPISSHKPRLLMLAQLPPPVHGSSLVSQSILESDYVREQLDIDSIDISTAKHLGSIGRVSLRKTLSGLGILMQVISYMTRKKYDLIYITLTPHGKAFYKDSFLALAARLLRGRVAYHLHGKGIARQLSRSRLRRHYYRLLFRRCKVIQLSSTLYGDISGIVALKDVYVVPNGIPSQDDNAVVSGSPNGRPRILYLSNMVPSKGAMVLLEGLKELNGRGCEFEAIFAGGWGPDRGFRDDFFRFIEENTLEHCIRYVGPVYGEEKRRLLNSADIFVLPTFFALEAFPLSILEAMSCGVPVISTYEGAIPEIVDDGRTGFLVKPECIGELSTKLQRCIDDPAMRMAMGRAGREKYSVAYSIEVFERAFVQAIERILGDYGET